MREIINKVHPYIHFHRKSVCMYTNNLNTNLIVSHEHTTKTVELFSSCVIPIADRAASVVKVYLMVKVVNKLYEYISQVVKDHALLFRGERETSYSLFG